MQMQSWSKGNHSTPQWLKPVHTYQGGHQARRKHLENPNPIKYLNFTMKISTKELKYSSDTEACPFSNTHTHTAHTWHTEVCTMKVWFNQFLWKVQVKIQLMKNVCNKISWCLRNFNILVQFMRYFEKEYKVESFSTLFTHFPQHWTLENLTQCWRAQMWMRQSLK